jgi:DNA polymerase elongation subunit (family B)
MMNYQEGDATQKILNKSYYDIEIAYDPNVFPDPENAAYPVNAIAVYNNILNEATIFALPYKQKPTDEKQITKQVNDIYDQVCSENSTYIVDDIQIKVQVFYRETELLQEFFTYVRDLDTLFLIGFNSALFDDPYVVNRGLNLLGEPIYDYISDFGEVSKFGDRGYDWPDYLKVDLLKLYRPVDQGGSGFGKSLPNYKLNTVAEFELGITKLDLDDMNETYQTDLPRFLAYNLLDTLLTFKLDEKLQFLELQWMLAKMNDAPLSSAINGRSIMYRYRNNLIYSKRQQAIRAKLFNREVFYPIIEEGG